MRVSGEAMIYHDDGQAVFHHGDVRECLRELPEASVHCVVTSPPYFALRDYGVAGQIGLEDSPEDYICTMVEVFREVRRVLREDATLWLNIGDSYAGSWGAQGRDGEMADRSVISAQQIAAAARRNSHTGTIRSPGLKPKDLVGIPWMLAFALRADGWWLRSDIIWSKPNPMPESVTDRPTKAHEYVFLLTKAQRYYYDADAVREPHAEPWRGQGEPEKNNWSVMGERGSHESLRLYNPAGRNKRTVWTIATQPYPEAHFATFPEDLVEPCVLAGTSEHGVCSECGAPWERVTERTPQPQREGHRERNVGGRTDGYTRLAFNGGVVPDSVQTTGWQPTCAHFGGHDDVVLDSDLHHRDGVGDVAVRNQQRAKVVAATVLDPFLGSGTTAYVAKKLGRRAIGIDLNATYLDLAVKRCAQMGMVL